VAGGECGRVAGMNGDGVSVPRVAAVRYVTPLREGGSVPALVEADDGHNYVVKLRGAGQGPRVLIAELIAGLLGHALGLAVPELALVDLDEAIARSEPDVEIQDILRASTGLNLGLRHLDGALTFDPGARRPVDPGVASRIVLLDSFVNNVDRTARNPNLMWWRGRLAPIDHGAALYWQHDWDGSLAAARPDRPFPLVRDHVLLPWADDLPGAAGAAVQAFDDARLDAVTAAIPDAWLAPLAQAPDAASQRAAYAEWLRARRAALPALAEEAARARAPRV
jgi:HipA-like protein